MGTTRRRPGRPARGEKVADRDAILAAAERAITRDGSSVSLDAIAAEAGVTKPVLYAKVGDRAALVDGLANRLADRLVVALDGVLDARAPDLQSLTEFVRTTLDTLDVERELFLYVTHAGAAAVDERLVLAARSAEPLAGLLAGWRRGHGLGESAALPWAYGVVGMLNMVALWWIEQRDRPSEILARELAELIWYGVRGRPD